MNVIATELPGLLVVAPRVFRDRRGFFTETYRASRYREAGIDCTFVQDNVSRSVQGTLRGLHFQVHHPQAKLVQVLAGEIYDVALDLRGGSPTYGRWYGTHLSDRDFQQLFIPAGFAHGFCVLSPEVLFAYKCSTDYRPDDEGGITWNDPDLGIDWPLDNPRVSDKDSRLPRLAACNAAQLPRERYRP